MTIACIVAFHLLLTRTRLGTAIRATSDNDVLAEASGIETSRIIALVWFIGSALGGLGGIMLAADTQLSPTMGTGILIPVFAAAILGGLGSPYGAIAGAVVVAFAENIALSINWAPIVHDIGMTHLAYLSIPTGYGKAAPFLLLVFILIFRPRGIFSGSKS